MSDTVLITGASQGTGKATALLFARHGYDVVLAARQPERLEQVAVAVRAEGRQALAVPTDTSDVQQVEMLIQKALDRFGGVDVLVNNAGFYLSGLMEYTPLDDWHRLMDTNFWGYVHTIQGLLPQFLARGSGSYAYAYPQPEGYSTYPIQPMEAFYHPQLGEFILPYETVRQAADPAAMLLTFLHSTYEAAAILGKWDRTTLERA